MEEIIKLNAFVSWSGGKDGALSYYRAMKNFHVTHLLNMVAENGHIPIPRYQDGRSAIASRGNGSYNRSAEKLVGNLRGGV